MGTVMIPEFLLLGQIVKKEEAACSLLQKNETKKKPPQSLLSPPSTPLKPSLSCIHEEPAGNINEDGDDLQQQQQQQHTEGESRVPCGLSFLDFFTSFICPSRMEQQEEGEETQIP